MLTRKTWDEFRSAQLLWWVNRSLHLFGWAIVVECDEAGKVTECYPARCKFRGFSPANEADGFVGLTQHLAETAPELLDEVKL